MSQGSSETCGEGAGRSEFNCTRTDSGVDILFPSLLQVPLGISMAVKRTQRIILAYQERRAGPQTLMIQQKVTAPAHRRTRLCSTKVRKHKNSSRKKCYKDQTEGCENVVSFSSRPLIKEGKIVPERSSIQLCNIRATRTYFTHLFVFIPAASAYANGVTMMPLCCYSLLLKLLSSGV